MTGWRIGYVAAPQSAVSALDGVLQNSIGCAPAFIQRAAVVAMRDVDAEVRAMVAEYRDRRDQLCAAAATVPGFALSVPEGALYVWVDVSPSGRSQGGSRPVRSRLGVSSTSSSPAAERGHGGAAPPHVPRQGSNLRHRLRSEAGRKLACL
jgi:aspartate/methionine/tyrosine aminotransferase